MAGKSLPVSQIRSADVPYYAEVARLHGKKDELTIEDVRKLPGNSKISQERFLKLIKGIRRSAIEKKMDERPFAPRTFKKVSLQDVSIEFVRPSLARVEILSAAGGNVSHLEVGAAYYIDSMTPRSISVVTTRNVEGQTVVKAKNLFIRLTDVVENTHVKKITYRGSSYGSEGEAGPAGFTAADYVNAAWNLSLMLRENSIDDAELDRSFKSLSDKMTPTGPTIAGFNAGVLSLSGWLEKTTPDPECTRPPDNWYCPVPLNYIW